MTKKLAYPPFTIQLHAGQKMILDYPTRFRVVAAGRRWGKTETGKQIVANYAHQGLLCWWLSPTYQMAGQVWRDLKALLKPNVSGMSLSESERRLDLPGGGMIAIRSTHLPDNLRGAGLDFAVLDEAAYMPPTVWPQVVRPMLLDRQGGAIFLSTPNGLNWFYELYKLGLDPELDGLWQSFHFTAYDNPNIDPAELDQLRLITPDRIFSQEYLAHFTADAGQVFRAIHEAATAPANTLPIEGHRYIAGLDWGREHDFTCLVIIDADTRRMVALDRFHQVSWAQQRGRIAALCQHWSPAVIWAEANSIGAPNVEALQDEGLPVRPFTTTAASKKQAIESLALAIERRDLALLPDPVLLGELASYTLQRLPQGGFRYTAPPGAHDDTVIATALAWHGLQYSGLSIDFA